MRIAISFLLCLHFSFGTLAQNMETAMVDSDTTGFTSFTDNFYFELDGGSQLLFSEDAGNLSFKERLTPSFSLSFGTWFSPLWGAKLKIQGCSLNGFSTTEGIYTAAEGSSSLFEQDPVRSHVTINPDGTYRHFIRYANISVNVYVSLIQLITGNKNDVKFDIVPSAGMGNVHVFEYKGIPGNNSLSANFGLAGHYYLSPRLDFKISGDICFFDNDFEGRIAGTNDYDKYLSVSVGLSYFLKNRHF